MIGKITEKDFGPLQRVDVPKFHLHELCSALPEADQMDYDAMLRMAKELGGIWNDPGTVWEGKLLDGRNRMRVCVELGYPFEYKEFLGNYEQARNFVVAKNYTRRHLNQGQKTIIAVMICTLDKLRGCSKTGSLIKDIMLMANVSRASASRGIVLASRGSADDINKVLNAEISLADAAAKRKIEEKLGEVIGGDIAKEDELPEPEDEAYQDIKGVLVPDSLIDIWGGLAHFAVLKNHLDTILPELKRVIDHPSGHAISPEYYKTLRDLASDLENKQPAAVCPHCRGEKISHSEISIRRWRARGKEDCYDCYCCQGHGYLMRDEPWPSAEWIKPIPF
jgi:hypothetical protein